MLKNDRSNMLLHNQFKEDKKKVECSLNKAKNKYFREKFSTCKGDSGATWGVVKEMIPGLRSKDKLSYDNPSQKAEEFNDHFATVGEKAFRKSQEGLESRVPTDNVTTELHSSASFFRPQSVDVDSHINF